MAVALVAVTTLHQPHQAGVVAVELECFTAEARAVKAVVTDKTVVTAVDLPPLVQAGVAAALGQKAMPLLVECALMAATDIPAGTAPYGAAVEAALTQRKVVQVGMVVVMV
jgi:hypothetical protein